MNTNNTFNKIAVLFLGLPGSGKTTQSLLLKEKFNLLHLTTSRIIREKFRRIPVDQDVRIDEERKRYDAGHIIEPKLVASWVNEVVDRVFNDGYGVILDGSPRSVTEAELLLPNLARLYGEEKVFPIHLVIDPDSSFKRTSTRLICLNCEKAYSWNPNSDLKFCQDERCGGVLTRKLLDTPEVFQKRLEVFKKETQKAIDFFEFRNILSRVNGEQAAEDVFKDILMYIK